MAAAPANKTFQFKLVLLGESAVGKSSLVLRFVRGQFFDYQESTIGVRVGVVGCIVKNSKACPSAFLTQTVALNDTTVKFEIWDTAGQERYHSLAPMYYRGAAAAIVVYDITSPVSMRQTSEQCGLDSFARAKSWVRELQRQGNPNIVIALAGNKSDLASKRKVEPDEARQYAEENNIMFMETSAKTASNVNELFVQIARKLPKQQQEQKQGGAQVKLSEPARGGAGAKSAGCSGSSCVI
eukprot:508926-Rhodomonas_salina.3